MRTVINRGRRYFLLGEALQPHRLSSAAAVARPLERLVSDLMFD
jgi:hypothetical protein